MNNQDKKAWTVIFLIDKIPLDRLVLLYRAPTHTFAPLYYTGIGGKIEKGESAMESAYRELEEETGIDSVSLVEFARCHLLDVGTLHYFLGEYSNQKLPNCNEGTLEWVSKEALFTKKLIPTTAGVCHEWENRKFSISSTFTVNEKVISVNNVGVRTVKIVDVADGLH